MKKIGILTYYPMHGGGIFQYIQSMIDALKHDSSNQYIIFTDEDDTRFDQSGLEVRKVKPSNRSALNQLFIFFQLWSGLRNATFISKTEKKAFADIDLFLSPATSVYPHLFLKKPYIFTLHDMQEKYYPQAFTKSERWKRDLRNKALSRDAKAIICESNYVKNDIVNFLKAEEKKIAVIQSPPPDFLLNYSTEEKKFSQVREKYGLPANYIFYPAQCWFHKNHIKLVEAFEQVIKKSPEEVHLVLSGSQQNNYNNLMKKIAELNLESRVKHIGYIDYEDIPYLYRMSQMLVMPTLFESVSIPIYEAFALGVPVCCSNVVALPEQVGDAALIFDPHDIEDMSEKIVLLLRDKNLAETLVTKGKLRVNNFDHKNYLNKILSIV